MMKFTISSFKFATQIISDSKDQKIISYDKYSNTLIDKYAEYGYELEMDLKDEDYIFTQRMLNAELKKAKSYYDLRSKSCDKAQIISESDTKILSPCTMVEDVPGAKATSKDTTLFVSTNPIVPTFCTVRTSETFTIDVQKNTILSASSPTLSVMNATGIDDYIRLISYNSVINNSSKVVTERFVTYDIICELKERVSIGGVNSWSKVNKSFSIDIYPC